MREAGPCTPDSVQRAIRETQEDRRRELLLMPRRERLEFLALLAVKDREPWLALFAEDGVHVRGER